MGGITVDDFRSSVAYRDIFCLATRRAAKRAARKAAKPMPLASPSASSNYAAAP